MRLTKMQGIVIGAGAALVALNVWMLLNNEFIVLVILGLVSLLLLILTPFLTAVMTVRTTRREMKYTAGILKDCAYLNLRQHAVLLTFCAAILIPLFVFFYFYLQLYFTAIFSYTPMCSELPCNAPVNMAPPSTLVLQTNEALAIAIGLWGANLLADVVAVGLTMRGLKTANAILGTWLILVMPLVVIYQLFLTAANLQPHLIALATLLPFSLAIIAGLLLHLRPSQKQLEPTR